jgi:hypothetical protein
MPIVMMLVAAAGVGGRWRDQADGSCGEEKDAGHRSVLVRCAGSTLSLCNCCDYALIRPDTRDGWAEKKRLPESWHPTVAAL